jgi:hypothetical protein
MRLGRVEFTIGYVVDLDNTEMISEAKQLILEDIDAMDGRDKYSLISIEPAHSDYTEQDIHPILLGEFENDDFQENE